MSIDVRMVGETAVVALNGDVDLQSSPKLRKTLLKTLGGSRAMVVDLGAVSYIDSSGVASLVEAFQTARKTGARFALAAVSPAALRVLELARLDRVFTIHPSLDDALAAGEG